MSENGILDKVRIASPCHARWEDMTGSDRARFCGQCNKHVYNFSAMTRAEVESLIREKEGRLCGRFYRRRDGRMLTADCQVGGQRKRNRLARIGGAMAAFMMLLLGGCTRRSPAVQGSVAPPPEMGDVMYERPAATNSPPPSMGLIAIPNDAPPIPQPSAPSAK